MSDIQEEQKRLYKRAEENDLTQIAYKMTENTLLMKQAGDKAINKINELQDRINKAVGIIKKYGYEKQMEEDYLMNRVNLANYNCLLLDILQGSDKE